MARRIAHTHLVALQISADPGRDLIVTERVARCDGVEECLHLVGDMGSVTMLLLDVRWSVRARVFPMDLKILLVPEAKLQPDKL